MTESGGNMTKRQRGQLSLLHAALKPLTINDSYHLALGRFVACFAMAEMVFHASFHHYSKIPMGVGRVIKGAMRTSDLLSILRKLAVVNKFEASDIAILNECIDQFVEIGYLRDRILHAGATQRADGAFESHNIVTARALDQIIVTRFTIEDLLRCNIDLIHISVTIAALLMPQAFDAPPAYDEPHAWQYKAPPPSSKNQRYRLEIPKSKRQPPSSPEKV